MFIAQLKRAAHNIKSTVMLSGPMNRNLRCYYAEQIQDILVVTNRISEPSCISR